MTCCFCSVIGKCLPKCTCCTCPPEKNIIRIPEKRKKRARYASIAICAITAILIVVFCILKRNVVEYYPDATQKNTTNVCYREREKMTFSGLFTTALSLFGVVLGTLVDRVSLIFEESYHIKSRYDGKCMKMFKACFSGILWGPVVTLISLAAIILVILIFLTGKPWFELSYLVFIFSGIGVGPLIMQLLSLNTQSEVHISTIFEEKQTNVANGLAWSYYFNYLQKALPKFNERVPRNGSNTVKLEGQEEHVQLNSNKLILLITHDCKRDDLEELDNKIKKLGTFISDGHTFPVYELTTANEENQKYRYVIEYVNPPLEALEQMSRYGRIKALDEKQREYQVKLLYKTLCEILENPFNKECEDKCVLVGIHANSKQNLENGKLVQVIKNQVEADKSPRKQDDIIKVYSRKPTGDGAKLQLIKHMEENSDSSGIMNKDSAIHVSREEVGDNASGPSTSGLQGVITQQQNSSNNAHKKPAQTDQL